MLWLISECPSLELEIQRHLSPLHCVAVLLHLGPTAFNVSSERNRQDGVIENVMNQMSN